MRISGPLGWALGAMALLWGHPARADAPPIQRPRSLVVSSPSPEAEAPAAEAPAVEAPMAEAPAAEARAAEAPAAVAPAAEPPTWTNEAGPSPAARDLGDPVAPASAAAAAGPTGLRKRSGARGLGDFSHQGFTLDFRLGTMGCVKAMCGADRHDVQPGVRLDGFLGGNIKGWVDLGISGGWGAMSANPDKGTNVLALYGLDPYAMQQALGVIGGQALGIDLTAMAVHSAKLRTAQVGPMLRVHFIPRGRYAAWIGTGAQYNLLRARYDTAVGAAKIDFHGIAVPLEAGFAVHVLRNLAVGAQFDYAFTWYPLANIQSGGQSLTVPTRILDQAARMQNTAFKSQLPQFWTVALTLRARM